MKKQKKTEGITLIALVITIIVLLILAGVSIAVLTGENGILTKANDAKIDTEIGEEKEKIRLAYNATKIEAVIEGKSITATALNAEFVANGVNATASGSDPIKVKFNATGREYTIDNNGTIAGPTEGKNQEIGEAPIIERLTYTRNENRLNLNTVAYELEPLDEQYIGELTLAEGVTYGFEKKEDGTIVSEELENPESDTFANSYIKVDLTNEEDDAIVNIQVTTSSKEQCGAIAVKNNAENLMMTLPPDIIMEPKETKEYTLDLEAGKENYIHFGYIYAGKDEENGITDSFKINKLKIYIKNSNDELTYKYTVNGIQQESNVITMDATKLQGQEAVKVGNVVQIPKIPVGFRHTIGTIDEGYVISDLDQDSYKVEVEVTNSAGKKATATKEIIGNEFVWIPVNEENVFERRDGYSGYWLGEKESIEIYPEADATGLDTGIGESAETIEEAKNMYDSVGANGGFYIGRYETGNEGGTFDEINQKWDNKGYAVVKKNMQVYNYIGWINNQGKNDETGGAVELARTFASIQGHDTNQVHSTLCYGVQWETALNFIDPGYNEYAKDSTGKGNYSGQQIKTGSNNNYALKNIYDMAGNVSEWTMEQTGCGRARRGGNYYNSGRGGCASVHEVDGNQMIMPYDTSNLWGFRIALYL